MIKAVIFDYDGVIGDTEQWQYQTWNETLKPYNISISKEEYVRELCGRQGEDIDKEIINKFKLNIPYGALVKKKEKLILEWFRTKPIPLMPNVKKIIKKIKDMQLLIGIASSVPTNELKIKIKKLGLTFDAMTSKEEVKHSKPDPEIYTLTAKKLNVAPIECVVFEDSSPGVVAAKRAGMFVIAIPTEWSAKQDFSMADANVRNLSEGLDILKKLIDKTKLKI